MVFRRSWNVVTLAAFLTLMAGAVAVPMLLDPSVNTTGRGVAVALLASEAAVAAGFLSSKVVLTPDRLVSRYGLLRREYLYDDIANVSVGAGNGFGLKIPWLTLADGSRVGLGQIANGRRKDAALLVEAVQAELDGRSSS
jgi:hypothetical protein